MAERIGKDHALALEGNVEAMVVYATRDGSGGTFYGGSRLARPYGPDTMANFVSGYRVRMNSRASSEPETPEALGLGSNISDVPATHSRWSRFGVNSLNRTSLSRVVEALFVKPVQVK